MTDSFLEGSYRWESDKSPVNYTHWAKKEPNDFGGVEDCVAVYWGGLAGFWNDDYCDSEHYYICEKVNGILRKLHCIDSISIGAGLVQSRLPQIEKKKCKYSSIVKLTTKV